MSLAFLFHLLNAQHVSDVNTSILRSLRIFVELFHGLYCSGTMCVGVTLWFGWGGVVSGCRLKHCFSLHKDLHYMLYHSWIKRDQLDVTCFFISLFNLLAPELFFLISAHPVYKMWIKQEPNTLELWNKLHFEEEKNGEYIPCLKYSLSIFVE